MNRYYQEFSNARKTTPMGVIVVDTRKATRIAGGMEYAASDTKGPRTVDSNHLHRRCKPITKEQAESSQASPTLEGQDTPQTVSFQ